MQPQKSEGGKNGMKNEYYDTDFDGVPMFPGIDGETT